MKRVSKVQRRLAPSDSDVPSCSSTSYYRQEQLRPPSQSTYTYGSATRRQDDRLPRLDDSPGTSRDDSSFSSTGARISDRGRVLYSSEDDDDDERLFSPLVRPPRRLPPSGAPSSSLHQSRTTPNRRRSFHGASGGAGGSTSKYRRFGSQRRSCRDNQRPPPPAAVLPVQQPIALTACCQQPGLYHSPDFQAYLERHHQMGDSAVSTRRRPQSLAAETSFSSPADLMYSEIRKTAKDPRREDLSQAASYDSLRLKELNREAARQRRVCFREAFSLSSIKEISPISNANGDQQARLYNSPEDNSPTSSSGKRSSTNGASVGRLLGMNVSTSSPDSEGLRRVAMPPPPAPVPSPTLLYRSPSKPVPKTNPYYGSTPSKVRLGVTGGRRSASSISHVGHGGGGASSSAMSSAVVVGDDPYEQENEYVSRDQLRPAAASQATQKALKGLKTFGIKGQLYVIILLNRQLMTVTIDVGKHFQSSNGQPCNSYVRISFLPEDERRPHYRTNLIPRTNNPVFNQTFTFELRPEDWHKRVLLSVWNKDLTTQKSSLLGCMAFTIKNISQPDKEVNGWYFLLAPSVGKKKHLAVDKVKMLTYYGSVDSGLQTTSESSAAAAGNTTDFAGRSQPQQPRSLQERNQYCDLGRRSPVSLDDDATRQRSHQRAPLGPSAPTYSPFTLGGASSAAPTRVGTLPPEVNPVAVRLARPLNSVDTTNSTTDLSVSHRGCVSDATSDTTSTTNTNSYRYRRHTELTSSSATSGSLSRHPPPPPPPAIFVMNARGGVIDNAETSAAAAVAATPAMLDDDSNPSTDTELEKQEQGDFLKLSLYDEGPLRKARSLSGQDFPAAAQENGRPARGDPGNCRKISAQEMSAYSKQIALELTAMDRHQQKGGGVGVGPRVTVPIDLDAQVKKKRSFAGPFVKTFNFLKKRSAEECASGTAAPGTTAASSDGGTRRQHSASTSAAMIRASSLAASSSDALTAAKASSKLSRDELLLWHNSFDRLLKNKHGLALFKLFLQREFSDENIDFWIACEEYKKTKETKLPQKAKEIYQEFVAVQSCKEVNLDSDTRSATREALDEPTRATFEVAQMKIEHLMEKDSYPRFLKCDLYQELLASCKK